MHDTGVANSAVGVERSGKQPISGQALTWFREPSPGTRRPRAILFDVGMTLIHARAGLLLEEMTADGVDTSGLSGADAARALLLAAEARHMPMPAGLGGTEKVAAATVHLLGIQHPAAVGACLRGLERDDLYRELDPDAVPALTALRDAGLRLGAVSNSAGTVRDDLAAFGLLRFFDVVVDSTVLGFEKPHPHPFRTALAQLGLPGEACWYVGDGLYNDVLGARAAGYAHSVLVDRFDNFAAVPGLVRIRRLTELTSLVDQAEPTADGGDLAADPGEADRLAVIAVRAMSTRWDPHAQVSTPVWRRTEQLADDIVQRLRQASSAAPAPLAVEPAMAALRVAPLDTGARARVGTAVRHLMTADPLVLADLREPLLVFERRNRLDLHLGRRYHPSRKQPPVGPAQLATACQPTATEAPSGRWEVTVVVDFRDTEGGARLRNTVATLAALHDQSMPRRAYRIVVVEQDDQPRHRGLVAGLADRYVLASHGGPYNRSWAHNVGAVATGAAERYLCFLDADVLPDHDFLAVCHDYLRDSGARVLLPHASLLYLDQHSSEVAVQQRLLDGTPAVDLEDCYGYRLMTNRGGCLFVESALFHAVGGYDERYEGWGDEDNEFYERLAERTPIAQLAFDLPHLHHPRPSMENDGRRPNQWLVGVRHGRPTAIGDPDRYLAASGHCGGVQ